MTTDPVGTRVGRRPERCVCDTDMDLPPSKHSWEMKTTCHTGGGTSGRPGRLLPPEPSPPALLPRAHTGSSVSKTMLRKSHLCFSYSFKNGYARKDQKDPFGSAFSLVLSLAMLCYVLLDQGLPTTVQK